MAVSARSIICIFICLFIATPRSLNSIESRLKLSNRFSFVKTNRETLRQLILM